MTAIPWTGFQKLLEFPRKSAQGLSSLCRNWCSRQVRNIMYALGWTQHTVGVQNIRLSAIIQLLLGNIGQAGGAINALRGEPNVQGSTDHAILWHIIPGYNAVPNANWQTLDEYMAANTPKSNDPKSANWWQNRPKYVVSLLKAWFGEAGTKENGFGYNWVPKVDPGKDYASASCMTRCTEAISKAASYSE
jgi:formate dehydrogenase major subunit